MIEINYKKRWFGRGVIRIPNRWEELSEKEFIDTIALVECAASGNYPVNTFRLMLLELLSGYRRSKKRMNYNSIETINSNLFILASQLKFAIKPLYQNTEYFEVLSEELQSLLTDNFPFDIVGADHLPELEMIGDKLRWVPQIRLNMKSNPLPEIYLKKVKYKGPWFRVDDNGNAETDIVAQEWIDALEMQHALELFNNRLYLAGMIAVLYRPERRGYNSYDIIARRDQIKNLPDKTLRAAMYVFCNIVEYVHKHPLYSILFCSVGESKKKIVTGGSTMIASLTKAGYGPPSELQQKPLFEYLDILIDSINTAVATFRANEVKDFEISKKLNLPLEVIQRF